MFAERAVSFECDGQQLSGIFHSGAAAARTGVLVIVGGPQYRVGSHRQFVHLARHLSAQGVPVLRFDVTGMGDSEGNKRSFDSLDSDIAAAVDAFYRYSAGLDAVVLWGLCDGASAALIYAHTDARVKGLVLVNPWLENNQAQAKAQVSDYYFRRLGNPLFWQKVLSGRSQLLRSAMEFLQTLYRALCSKQSPVADTQHPAYQQRMLEGFRQFDGDSLLLLSGNDLTAKAFSLQVEGDRKSVV